MNNKILFLMTILVLAWPVQAVSEVSRFQKVEKLLTVSSAAQRIEGSDNTEARARLDDARNLAAEAMRAGKAGDEARSVELLQEATTVMLEATRMVKKDKSIEIKDLRDFDTRMESINALCDAYHTIRKEKGLGDPEDSELYPFVQAKIADARRLKEKNQLRKGRKVLDEAYVAAKVAIEHLRGGETLVRSLTFETHEEEYRYELDRNDTHTMLVTVLLKDKVDSNDSIKSMVEKYMIKARSLRKMADKQADDGEYEAAISTMEQSTKEIVRAIRSAGIYIPG